MVGLQFFKNICKRKITFPWKQPFCDLQRVNQRDSHVFVEKLKLNPKGDQCGHGLSINLQFIPLSETTSIPVTFIWEFPPGRELRNSERFFLCRYFAYAVLFGCTLITHNRIFMNIKGLLAKKELSEEYTTITISPCSMQDMSVTWIYSSLVAFSSPTSLL